jgi:hypothetical protein
MRTLWLVMLGACGGSSMQTPDAGSRADARPDAAHKNFGLVGVIEDVAMNSTFVLAGWGTDLDIIVASRDDGPCHVQQANLGTMPRVSAGTVTITGGSAAAVTMPFDVDNGYFSVAQGLSYAPGDQLTISASGGVVPAFSGQLAFPAPLTVTSGTPTVVKKSGFTATWNATTSPVVIGISQYPSGAPKLNISCTYDGATGTGAIPASALSDLMTTVSVGVLVSAETNVTMMAGDYPADLRAAYAALQKNGIPVQP